jgi:ABC-2 type transport system permease protein
MAWLIPTVNAQMSLNAVAQTDLEHHLAYLDSVRGFHEQARKIFYSYLLSNQPAPAVDWQRMPRHQFADEERSVPFPAPSISLLLIGASFCVIGLRRLRSGSGNQSKGEGEITN